jgi:hypothetical protein
MSWYGQSPAVRQALLRSTPRLSQFGYYASVQPIPDGKGFILASASSALNGLIYLNANFQEQFRITGTPCTDCDVVKYSGRIYLAYTAHSGSVATMRICDITDGLEASSAEPDLQYDDEG